MTRLGNWGSWALLVGLAVFSAACGGSPDGGASSTVAELEDSGVRHLVLVTVDTLRADHLACYGYPRDTSPAIDGLAADGVVFERAYATSGTTIPSHLSMFTGLLPHQHGYLRNQDAAQRPVRPEVGRQTIAEALGAAGYLTAGFVSSAPVSRRAGMHLGFQVFSDPKDARRKGKITNRRMTRWLRAAVSEGQVGPQRPLFLWVHYWDVHEPNDPPEPYASMFPPNAESEALVRARGVDPAKLTEAFSPFYRARHFDVQAYVEHGRKLDDGPGTPVTMDQVLDLYRRYDGDVRYTDDQVGELVELLRETGLWDQTVFCLTADHGQSLGQHNWLEHGRVTEENVLVPWILRAPGLAPGRVSGLVSLLDLGPTLASQLRSVNLDAYLQASEGKDALARGFERAYAVAHRSTRQSDRAWEETRVVLTDQRWKLAYSRESTPELYDLDADPLEQHDLAAEYPAVVERLLRQVKSTLARRPAGEGGEHGETNTALSSELESLGYAGDDE